MIRRWTSVLLLGLAFSFIVGSLIGWSANASKAIRKSVSVASTLIGVTTTGDVYSIDTATGASTLIGSNSGSAFRGLSNSPSNTLYTNDWGNAFQFLSLTTINPTTGAKGADVGSGTLALISLAVNSTGTLYAYRDDSGTDQLVTIDTATGATTNVGTRLVYNPGGMAFIGSTLYVSASGDGLGLVTVDLTTGAPTDVNPAVSDSWRALAYVGGILYGMDGTSLYTINVATGQGTLIGSGTYNGLVTGIAPGSTNSAPTLTPATLAVVPGSPAQTRQIATVSDPNQTADTLTVTINGGAMATVNGVTVSNLSINAAGQVTATVNAAANATPASFTLKVTDNGGLMDTKTLLVNPVPLTARIGDPAVCLEPGGLIGHEATLTNPNNVALVSSLTATLPAGLTAVAGSCLANVPGTCTVAANGSSVSWNGTLPANTTVTMVYRTRAAASAVNGTQFCVDNAGNLGGVLANLQFCFTLNCPAILNTRVTDQKAGSVLVFPYYTSTIGGASDTRLTISNISNAPSTVANQTYVHLFLIDGTTCNQADLFLCLTPNASFSFKASEYDPGNTGYVLAVAVNNQGVPIQNNVLIGNAFVRTPDFADNYGAESFWANSFAVATVSGNAATLYFDQVGYDAVPKQFAVEIQSPVDVVGQQVVTAGMSGDLTTSTMSGAAQIGIGQAYNEKEQFGSFNVWLTGTCQARGVIATNSPRVPNGLNNLIKTGQSGSLKFNVGGAVGLLLTPRTARWHGIRTLHKTQTTATTITIPIFAPIC